MPFLLRGHLPQAFAGCCLWMDAFRSPRSGAGMLHAGFALELYRPDSRTL